MFIKFHSFRMSLIMCSLCILLSISSIDASDQTVNIQLKGMGLYATDSQMQDIFDDVWPQYGIEVDWLCKPCFSPWIDVNYYEKTGNSTCENIGIDVSSIGMSLGFKSYFLETSCFRQYIGFGVGFDYVIFDTCADYVENRVCKWTPSITVKLGMEIKLLCNYFINLFGGYTHNWVDNGGCRDGVEGNNLSTAGAIFGVGIGYRICCR